MKELFSIGLVTNSLCVPGPVILTGKYSRINGFKDNTDKFYADQQTLSEIFKRNGYNTAIVGKGHLKSQPKDFDY